MKVGKVSESVLKRSVLKQITNQNKEVKNGADIGEDCAVFAQKNGYTVQSVQTFFVTSPSEVYVPIMKAVNGIAVRGAHPVAVLLTLLLPADTEESFLRELMKKANEAAGILHIQIAGGHTEVSENCSVPYVTATAIGSVEGEALFENHIRPGQDIVLTGQVGCEGAGLLATRYEERLAERYPLHMIEKAQAFLQELSILPEAATAIKSNAGAMHDVSGGGIFASLWELAESAGVGLAVDLKAIPIRQECVEVCEFFGISPYEMLSGGSLLITTDNGEHLVRDLKEAGILAAVIGKITDNNDRVVINQEEKRFLDRPVSDEFSKIKGENL